ncbi:hypothetical protein TST_0583 [Thermosulfidibacter takaii ABI70S6]|uniref:ABC-type transport auxiliary lipoprotein component domain-containing protein n=1 Tax=Thermosulfidibacter takaii (strain DSM 17441 / JCM 13301 / NBRC 103674 / ABI70S6) TaxID=1298851 RepID=A0A0S3QSS9_THET7|nr:hypothetical protein [Thermosulfidibacter takaii]BAT71389.1 hypothetical protein TST_0583 [Thermosulfidibacter takaii ABI70S6]
MKRLILAILPLFVFLACFPVSNKKRNVYYFRLEPSYSLNGTYNGTSCLYKVEAVGLLNGNRIVYKKDSYYCKYSSFFWFCSVPCMLRETLLSRVFSGKNCVGNRLLNLYVWDFEPVVEDQESFAYVKISGVIVDPDDHSLSSRTFEYRIPSANSSFLGYKQALDKATELFLKDLVQWLNSFGETGNERD